MKRIQKLFFMMIMVSVLIGCNAEKESNEEKKVEEKDWAINHIVINKDHKQGKRKVKIAILDSGISKINELKDSIIYSYNTIDGSEVTNDVYGHGTMVASLIASQSTKFENISLNPHVEILDIQVLNDKGQGNIESVVEGINKAIEKNVDIINLSIGFSNDSIKLKEVVDKAMAKGINVVASTGNTLGYSTDYPAKYNGVISVSAIDKENSIYIHAGKGKVDVVAPGVDIPVINGKSQLDYQSGTSFATAYVSGIISLYLEDGESIDRNFLKNKSTELGNSKTYGIGLLTYN